MIRFRNLTKSYGTGRGVFDLSFEITDGEVFGLLGPENSGKTTIFSLLLGFSTPGNGWCSVDGRNCHDHAKDLPCQIGYLPEQPPLYMDMTVIEYLRLAAELKKVPKKDRENMIADIMDTVQLTHMKDRLIKNLSKGYKQRTGLAQALMGYPEVIILDEPTVGLDPKQIIEIRDLIKELGKKHTIILSSHILSEISAVCDHVFIISHGKLVASDSTENLLERMTGAQEIELLVKAEEDTAETAIREVAQVERCEKTESKEDGAVQLLVTAKKDADVREAIYHTCVEHHMPILEMKAASKSLEDVFLELTSQEGGTK